MGTKTTSETKLPEFQQKFLEETVLPYAQDIAGREFTPYEGERVAGMTPLQQQAMTGYGALSMGGPQFQQAAETYGQLADFGMTPMQAATAGPAERAAAAQLGGVATMEGVGAVEAAQAPEQIAVDTLAATDIGQYMSPYTQNVIESSLRTLGGAQDIALDKLAAQAQAARTGRGWRIGRRTARGDHARRRAIAFGVGKIAGQLAHEGPSVCDRGQGVLVGQLFEILDSLTAFVQFLAHVVDGSF